MSASQLPRLSRPTHGWIQRSVLVLIVALLVASFAAMAPPTMAAPGNLALNKPVTVSSNENIGAFPPAAAVDGNTGTRWSSGFSDAEWIQVDLGSSQSIGRVVLNWEPAYGKGYQLQTAAAAAGPWTTIYSTSTGDGGIDDLPVAGAGRYLRMNGITRALTAYGYSLWEFEAYAPSSATATPTNTPIPSGCGTMNAALNKPATASSVTGANTANLAFDGNAGTRWESQQGVDPQWLRVDLGSTTSICRVRLNWEPAYAKSYQIQTSNDGATWTTIASTTTGDGGIDDLTNLSGSGRYLRMNGTVRATVYGYSLWEMEVYTGSGTGPTPTSAPTPTATSAPTPTNTGVCAQPNVPNFGSNVRIFDTSMSAATIQSQLDADFNLMKDTQTAQFSENRRAHLFKPGSYSVSDNVGFYTSVAGLGINPTDVTINGAVTVDAFNASDAGNATQNFWRSAENLSINTNGGADRWAVAQAAPFRRMNIIGGLNVYPASFGWASGGYISDVKVSGLVASASQQQWYSKDSNFGSWDGAVWNMVFSGVVGAPAASFPASPKTVLGTTPGLARCAVPVHRLGRQLPCLCAIAAHQCVGHQLAEHAGQLATHEPVLCGQDGDTAASINGALNQGCNLFFTPGVYHVNQTINVSRANTIVLGIGYPTIVNDGGVNAMQVGNVDGVRIKGLLFDAGTTLANTLLTIGTAGNPTSHASNPVSIQDVFFRIGGQFAGKATNSLIVSSNDTIIDHIWAWRADHGSGVGWSANTADTGLIVNANNVLATGLFVEHYQKYEVMWNGQNGKIIFFQNEMPYDPPNQAAWMNGSTNGYAAIKLANAVTAFEAWGLGSYCFFNANPAVVAARAYEAPNVAGVKWHNLSTVSLGNMGAIINVINTTGPQTPTNSTPATVASYP